MIAKCVAQPKAVLAAMLSGKYHPKQARQMGDLGTFRVVLDVGALAEPQIALT